MFASLIQTEKTEMMDQDISGIILGIKDKALMGVMKDKTAFKMLYKLELL